MARITIDPITRIEGHLKIGSVTDNKVTDAWSSGHCSGYRTILKGRDPNDAWLLHKECAVYAYVHGEASVRSVEHALDIKFLQMRIVRNLLIGSVRA